MYAHTRVRDCLIVNASVLTRLYGLPLSFFLRSFNFSPRGENERGGKESGENV